MMRSLTIIALVAVSLFSANGQQNSYDYYHNNSPSEESPSLIAADDELFYIPLLGRQDHFTRMSEYGFSSVRYSRRGYDNEHRSVYLDNIALPITDYSLPAAFRRLGFDMRAFPGISSSDEVPGAIGGHMIYSSELQKLDNSRIISVSAMNRKAEMGVRWQAIRTIRNKWKYAASVWGRWGRDYMANGVFTTELSFLFAAERSFGNGHRLTVLAFVAPQQNGLRSYATKEAFELTGDKLYNPSWGDFNSKKRNSKVRRLFQPFVSLSYSGRLSGSTTLAASVACRFEEGSTSALAWYGADNPYPDYYRNMPSYAESPAAEAIIKDKWINEGEEVRQINWGRLHDQNLNRKDGTAYLLEARVKNVDKFQFALTAHTKFDKEVMISYGLRASAGNARLFKLVDDLLGGNPFKDIDPFLDGARHNNIRDRDRRVEEGDRFGYNYHMDELEYGVFSLLRYQRERFSLSAGAELGGTSYRRNGKYEKELFSGNASYGQSKKVSFNRYNINLSGDYYFSPGHSLCLTGMAASVAPDYGNVFISPQYTNRVIDNPKATALLSAEIRYRLAVKSVDIRFNAYVTTQKSGTELYRYYDDISSRYSDMTVRGVDKRYLGAEIAVKYDFSPRISATLIAAVAKNSYTSNPAVDIADNATGEVYVKGSQSHLDGFRTGGSPELTTSAELSYNARGWLASATYSYAAGRYMTPNPLWRMERAYNMATSPEGYREFVGQEKLPDAASVGLFVMKTFYIRNSRLSALISINNLLNNRDIIYNGYEQMRIMRRGPSANRRYTPFDRKYLYGYGRTFYASLIYKF